MSEGKLLLEELREEIRKREAAERERDEARVEVEILKNHRARVQAALGNGADDDLWRPGHLWADEAAFHIRAVLALRETVRTLEEERDQARREVRLSCGWEESAKQAQSDRAVLQCDNRIVSEKVRGLEEEKAQALAALAPTCDSETLIGAIRNLQQAFISERDNADKLQRENAKLRAALAILDEWKFSDGDNAPRSRHTETFIYGYESALRDVRRAVRTTLNPPTPEPEPREATADERTGRVTCKRCGGDDAFSCLCPKLCPHPVEHEPISHPNDRWDYCGKPLVNGACPDHPAEGKEGERGR